MSLFRSGKELVEVAGFKGFQVGIGVLGLEIIPGKESVEGIKVFAFGNEQIFPRRFDFAIGEDVKKLAYFG